MYTKNKNKIKWPLFLLQMSRTVSTDRFYTPAYKLKYVLPKKHFSILKLSEKTKIRND